MIGKAKIDLIPKKPLLFGCFSKMGRRPINKMLIPLFAARSGGPLGANR